MRTYTNPVFAGYMADPFVLTYEGGYFAFGTGPVAADGRVFPVLRSVDLVHWSPVGGALDPIPGAVEYWAPEVATSGGKFYLYYSARFADGRDHTLRVAASAQPWGPFQDCGLALTPDQPFAIDPHPFQNGDGQWFLFYSRDFLTLDGEFRVGTGIVVDRLVDMAHLAGDPRPVIRPHAEWQLFMPKRPMYGGTYDWYTIEGAALRVHEGRYYCFYSGGAWERDNYGVSYVVADHPLGPYQRPGDMDGPLLRSVAGRVRGPGHNSFVQTPDGQEYIVYHAWDEGLTARTMRIDRLRWEGGQPRTDGPTWTPQPVPAISARPTDAPGSPW